MTPQQTAETVITHRHSGDMAEFQQEFFGACPHAMFPAKS